MKILYIHGFRGEPYGKSFEVLKKILPEHEIYSPEIPFMNPEESLKLIRELSPSFDLIISSSLGSFYSMQQSGKFKILINPALPKDLINIDNSLSIDYINNLNKQLEKHLKLLDFELKNETYLIFGNNDEVAKNKLYFEELYYPDQIKYVEMGHSLEYSEELSSTIRNIISEVENELLGTTRNS